MSDLIWRKSSRSGSKECVEVARARPNIRAVRDSKDPNGGILEFQPATFESFMANIKSGRFDR